MGAGLFHGYNLESQGIRNKEGEHRTLYEINKGRSAFGLGFRESYQNRINPATGKLQYRAAAGQEGRIAHGQDEWFDAPPEAQAQLQRYKASGAKNWEEFALGKFKDRVVGSGKFKPGGDGLFYNAAGQAMDAQGNRLNDDKYAKPEMGRKLFGEGANGMPGSDGSSETGGSPSLETSLEEGLKQLLADGGPFTPEVIAQLQSKAFLNSRGQAKTQGDAINRDALARGMYGAGATAELQAGTDRAAASDYSANASNIDTQAVQANHTAKLAALDRAQQWLDQKRQFILAQTGQAQQKELALKQISLGYAQIEAQKSSLQAQLAQNQSQFDTLNGPITIMVDGVPTQVDRSVLGLINQYGGY